MVILILILMNVQFLRDVVSSFEKGWNSQNHSSSDFRKPMKNLLHSKIFNCLHLGKFSPTPNGIWKKPELFICMTRGFLKKITKVKITFVYMLGTIMIKKSLEQTMKHKIA